MEEQDLRKLNQAQASGCYSIAAQYLSTVIEEADERISQFQEIINILKRAKENPESLYESNFMYGNDEIPEALIKTIWDIGSPRSWKDAAEGYEAQS